MNQWTKTTENIKSCGPTETKYSCLFTVDKTDPFVDFWKKQCKGPLNIKNRIIQKIIINEDQTSKQTKTMQHLRISQIPKKSLLGRMY